MSATTSPTARGIHMVGIGGAGMSALARLAVHAGYQVSGTDRDDSDTLSALRALGARVQAGHTSDAVPAGTQTLVVSTAIAEDNPELLEAHRRGIEIIHRADLLSELMSLRRGIGVAGAHGKSTTSAMLTVALSDASACVGATIDGGEGTGARWGTGEWFVAEADESDRSLLKLDVEAAILLNVDHDHHATYASLEEVEDVFERFLKKVPQDGVVVVSDDSGARRCAARAGRPTITVGADGDWTVRTQGPGAAVVRHQEHGEVHLGLQVPGAHNISNAACTLAMAVWCGVPAEVAAARLGSYTGVGRRFELRGHAAGITVVDDYAHHPSEITATLAAARERTHGKVIVIFQPHLPSRTRALTRELGEALAGADIAIVTDIYLAREPADPSISGRDVVRAVPGGTEVIYAPTLAEAADAAIGHATSGDLLMTMGAGDVTSLGQELVTRMENQHTDAASVHGDPSAP